MQLSELAQAARDGNLPAVLDALQSHPVDEALPTGQRPLHLALRGGHIAIVRALVEAGADLAAPSNRGETPLMVAISWCAEALPLFRGVPLDATTVDGDDALTRAVPAGDHLVRTLLEWGATPSLAALREADEIGAVKSAACLLMAGLRAHGLEHPVVAWLATNPTAPEVADLARPLPAAGRVTTWRGRHGRRLKIGVDRVEVWREGREALDVHAFIAGQLDAQLSDFQARDLDQARTNLGLARRHPTLVAEWLEARGVL